MDLRFSILYSNCLAEAGQVGFTGEMALRFGKTGQYTFKFRRRFQLLFWLQKEVVLSGPIL